MFQKIMIVLTLSLLVFTIIGTIIGLMIKRNNPKGNAPNIMRGK